MWFRTLLLILVTLVSLWDWRGQENAVASQQQELKERLEVLERKLADLDDNVGHIHVDRSSDNRDVASALEIDNATRFFEMVERKVAEKDDDNGQHRGIDDLFTNVYLASPFVTDKDNVEKMHEMVRRKLTEKASKTKAELEVEEEGRPKRLKRQIVEAVKEQSLEDTKDGQSKIEIDMGEEGLQTFAEILLGAETMKKMEAKLEEYVDSWRESISITQKAMAELQKDDNSNNTEQSLEEPIELDDLNESLRHEDKELEDKQAKVDDLEQELSRLKDQLASTEREVVDLRVSMNEQRNTFEKKMNSKNEIIFELEASKELEDKESLIAIRDQEISELMDQLASKDQMLENKLNNKDKFIQEIEKELEGKESVIINKDREIIELKDELALKDQMLKVSRDEQVHKLENKLNNKNKIIQELREDKETLRKELEEKEAVVASNDEIRVGLDHEINDLRNERDKSTSELKQLKGLHEKQLHEFETKLNAKNKKIQELKNSHDSIVKQVGEKDQELAACNEKPLLSGTKKNVEGRTRKESAEKSALKRCREHLKEEGSLFVSLRHLYEGIRDKTMKIKRVKDVINDLYLSVVDACLKKYNEL